MTARRDAGTLLECVINVSEGRDTSVLDRLRDSAGTTLLDVHTDHDHHRSVFTLGGPASDVEAAARQLVARSLELIDLRTHHGVHPRLGSADVVPFVPLGPSITEVDLAAGDPQGLPWREALAARDRFAQWAAETLGLPCFLYGSGITLPEIRRRAFADLAPDRGPDVPHPSGGAAAVGVRPVLIAYNVWVEIDPSLVASGTADAVTVARQVARELRTPEVRTLGLSVDNRAQVSCNLVEPLRAAPDQVFDQVATRARELGARATGAELVGLLPRTILRRIPSDRWAELDLAEEKTIEFRLGQVRSAD